MTAALPGTTRTRLLTAADLLAAIALQRHVESDLPAGFIRGKTEAELAAYLGGAAGVAYGICSGDTLLAIGLLRLPDRQHPLSGECFPFVPETDWPLRAAMLEHAMVLPSARRSGYQQALICARIAHAKRCAGVRWICAGVQLANAASWRNLMRSGMVLVKSRTQAGRTLLALLMSLDDAVLHTRPSDQRWVIEQDAKGHAAALGAGYFGVRPGLGGTVIYQRRYESVHSFYDASLAHASRRRGSERASPTGPNFTSPDCRVRP
jgi:hypothetical protein